MGKTNEKTSHRFDSNYCKTHRNAIFTFSVFFCTCISLPLFLNEFEKNRFVMGFRFAPLFERVNNSHPPLNSFREAIIESESTMNQRKSEHHTTERRTRCSAAIFLRKTQHKYDITRRLPTPSWFI